MYIILYYYFTYVYCVCVCVLYTYNIHTLTHTHTHTKVMNEGWLDGSTSVVMAVTSRYIMVANAGFKVIVIITTIIITIVTILITIIPIMIYYYSLSISGNCGYKPLHHCR